MTEHGPAVEFKEVLKEEKKQINKLRKRRQKSTDGELELGEATSRDADLIGLAFSGGGIRSATFNLGVLQGLAKRKLLPVFDYLSTVSGGGYIGSWLCSWIKRCEKDATGSGLKTVIKWIMSERAEREHSLEADEIRFLRSYSNYLTPRTGFFSVDTWTLVATYLRNLILNLTVLVLALAALLLAPRILVLLYHSVVGLSTEDSNAIYYLAGAWGLLLFALIIVSCNLSGAGDAPVRETKLTHSSTIRFWVVLPTLVAAWLISAGIWLVRDIFNKPHDSLYSEWALGTCGLYVMLWIIAWAIGKRLAIRSALRNSTTWLYRNAIRALRQNSDDTEALSPPFHGATKKMVQGSVLLLTAIFAGTVVGPLFLVIATWFAEWQYRDGVEWNVPIFGMPMVVLVFALTSVIHIGLVGRAFSEEVREWWSRLGAELMLWTGFLTAVSALAAYGPWLANYLWTALPDWGKALSASGWIAGSAGGAVVAQRSSINSKNLSLAKKLLAAVAPYVFMLGLLLLLAWLVQYILPGIIGLIKDNEGLKHWLPKTPVLLVPGAVTTSDWMQLNDTLHVGLWIVLAALLLAAFIISWRVGINEFSLHALYRNRLVRCYLGATNLNRNANHFTGFDAQDDNLCLCEFRANQGYSGPYPIINTALNLVSGDELAWQKRKAQSFILSPLYCGYDFTPRRAARRAASKIKSGTGESLEKRLYDHAYVSAEEYADGISLGSAMSISGAAASPNMGYHSSPSLTFLMTVFNIRLGQWLGNPRHQWGWIRNSPGPLIGLNYLMYELLGLTNNRRGYAYLSDGGHFENLGLYELIRRRCRLILVCDGGEDRHMTFSDLGNAIEKCRSDFGIDIEIDTKPLHRKGGRRLSCQHFVVGTIRYDMVDSQAENGTLIYVKSTLTGNEPADVTAYAALNREFPHQPTADQWFNESQFESYRALGQHSIETVFKTVFGGDVGKLIKEFDKQRP